ncbi:DUF1810 domain-containing protein [Riemerella columbina]|uniref:DUF1810 domain-containing protein n=1 Tax=Riemerella columbina TaxID=103810 RepID=UPI00266EFF94|nr:DUF1810 domain-containing protein [Riemerella columbina]WKS94870.1 DUF1810 domain-containing protein [Riemerella columbina]
MMENRRLDRFIEAQKKAYPIALAEIQNGKKMSHWMWYIFPQIKGLGYSETSIYYAIADKTEAQDYLQHPILGTRLKEIFQALLTHRGTPIHQILGGDAVKLKSSATLFHTISGEVETVFSEVLATFFNHQQDEKTLTILNSI